MIREFVTFERYMEAIHALSVETNKSIHSLIGPLEERHCLEIGDNPQTICSYCKQRAKCGKEHLKKCTNFDGV